jgi:hypothetical protein
MEKRIDISKRLALVLIILTVLISAVSTWVLISSSIGPGEGSSVNDVLVRLNILKGPVREPVQTDSNTGDVTLFIAKSKGG